MKTWFDNGFSLIKNTILIAIAILFMYENELIYPKRIKPISIDSKYMCWRKEKKAFIFFSPALFLYFCHI